MLRRTLAAAVVAVILGPAAASASTGWTRYDADTWVRWHTRARVPHVGEDVTPALRAAVAAFLEARAAAVHQARAHHRAWLAARAAQAAAAAIRAAEHQAPPSVPQEANGGRQGGATPPAGGGYSGSVPALIRAYFPAAEEARALCTAHRESGFNPHAVNRRSGAAGVFQWMPRLWAWFASRAGWGGASVFSARANIAVAAWQVTRGGGWWPWNGGCV